VQVIYSYIFGALILSEAVNIVGIMGSVLVVLGVVIIELRAADLCFMAMRAGTNTRIYKLVARFCSF